MKCRNCGKEITEDNCRKVADWTFCPECFQKLLDKSEPERVQPEPGMETVAPATSEDRPRISCALCGKDIGDGPYKKVGVWTFCPDCYDSLLYRPEEGGGETREEEDSDVSSSASGDGAAEGLPETDRFNPVQSTVCAACGRPIPLRGAKMLDGELLCPDCYAALNRRIDVTLQFDTPQAHRAVATDGSEKKTGSSNKLTVCESCGREVDGDSLMEIEGFFICEACRSTDLDLALRLARKRHRKKMERLLLDSDAGS